MEIVLAILFFLCFVLVLITRFTPYLGFVLSVFILNAAAHFILGYRWLSALAIISAPLVVSAVRTIVYEIFRPIEVIEKKVVTE